MTLQSQTHYDCLQGSSVTSHPVSQPHASIPASTEHLGERPEGCSIKSACTDGLSGYLKDPDDFGSSAHSETKSRDVFLEGLRVVLTLQLQPRVLFISFFFALHIDAMLYV